MASQGPASKTLLSETVRLTAEGLRDKFCKVLRYILRKIASWCRPALAGIPASSVWPASEQTWNLRPDLPCGPASP